MEKRARLRSRTRITVICSRLTLLNGDQSSCGIMVDCSPDGICITLDHELQAGNIIMIRATGRMADITAANLPEGFRTLGLAEVKWSQPLKEGRFPCYSIGLKYLQN